MFVPSLFYLTPDTNLPGVTTLGQSGPGNNDNEGVLHISQFSKTQVSRSDTLMSYVGHSMAGGLTHLQRCRRLAFPNQSGPGSNGSHGVLHTRRIFRKGASPSVSFQFNTQENLFLIEILSLCRRYNQDILNPTDRKTNNDRKF